MSALAPALTYALPARRHSVVQFILHQPLGAGGLVFIVIMALAQSWRAGFGMLFWIIGIHALEAYFLNPKIMGNAARMHPVVVVFALIAGETAYGLVGALFAVPVAAVLVACFEFVRRKAQPVPVDLLGG